MHHQWINMDINNKAANVISPMATGNGAYIIHRLLEKCLKGYRVKCYHPHWTLVPFCLSMAAPIHNADIVHTTPDYAVFFRRRPVPMVVSFHNYMLDAWMRQFSSALQNLHYRTDLRLYTIRALQLAQAVTAVSHFTAECVRRDLRFKRPIKIIYNGVDTALFRPKPRLEKSHGEVRIFFSGNLTRRKGAHWLPAIADKLEKHARIYYTQGLRTRHTLPEHSNLRSIGPVPFEDMPARYQQMDILLMPTVREGFSLSILEAMACGLPVVASDCSSLPEQIDEGRGGFLCSVGDVDSFAERLNHLADSPNKNKEMGQYNRAKIEKHFTAKKMVNEYKRLFDTILA